MPKKSAGILLYRKAAAIEFLLVHPGGPFFAKKDAGSWSIPKGEIDAGEDPESCARREFKEELGFEAPERLIPIGQVRQKGGKHVYAFAGKYDREGSFGFSCSSLVEIEWPPGSGRKRNFPEIDKAQFFPIEEAKHKILQHRFRLSTDWPSCSKIGLTDTQALSRPSPALSCPDLPLSCQG